MMVIVILKIPWFFSSLPLLPVPTYVQSLYICLSYLQTNYPHFEAYLAIPFKSKSEIMSLFCCTPHCNFKFFYLFSLLKKKKKKLKCTLTKTRTQKELLFWMNRRPPLVKRNWKEKHKMTSHERRIPVAMSPMIVTTSCPSTLIPRSSCFLPSSTSSSHH